MGADEHVQSTTVQHDGHTTTTVQQPAGSVRLTQHNSNSTYLMVLVILSVTTAVYCG